MLKTKQDYQFAAAKSFLNRLHGWLEEQAMVKSVEVATPEGMSLVALLPGYDLMVEIEPQELRAPFEQACDLVAAEWLGGPVVMERSGHNGVGYMEVQLSALYLAEFGLFPGETIGACIRVLSADGWDESGEYPIETDVSSEEQDPRVIADGILKACSEWSLHP